MIHLKRISKPVELTDEYVLQHVEEYKKHEKDVWNVSFIRERLMKMCYGKCSYCESAIGEESSYLSVDHFFPKTLYPDEVLEWKNLVPSCSFCNSSKKELNTRVVPIINPYKDIPQQHLRLNANYISYVPIDDKGKNTQKHLNLNKTEKRAVARYRVISEMEKKLADLSVLIIEDFINNPKIIELLHKSVGDVLQICQPTERYSAILATFVLNNVNYQKIKEALRQHDAWDAKMDILEKQMKSIKYQVDQ